MDFAISNNFCLLHTFGVWLPRNTVAVAIGNNNMMATATATAVVKFMCNIIKFICIPHPDVPYILFNFCIQCRVGDTHTQLCKTHCQQLCETTIIKKSCKLRWFFVGDTCSTKLVGVLMKGANARRPTKGASTRWVDVGCRPVACGHLLATTTL